MRQTFTGKIQKGNKGEQFCIENGNCIGPFIWSENSGFLSHHPFVSYISEPNRVWIQQLINCEMHSQSLGAHMKHSPEKGRALSRWPTAISLALNFDPC